MIPSTEDQHRASACHGHSGTDGYAITVSTADTNGSGGGGLKALVQKLNGSPESDRFCPRFSDQEVSWCFT